MSAPSSATFSSVRRAARSMPPIHPNSTQWRGSGIAGGAHGHHEIAAVREDRRGYADSGLGCEGVQPAHLRLDLGERAPVREVHAKDVRIACVRIHPEHRVELVRDQTEAPDAKVIALERRCRHGAEPPGLAGIRELLERPHARRVAEGNPLITEIDEHLATNRRSA